MAKIDANLVREYEAYKDASKEELDEYLSKLPPSKRQAYLDYAAKMEAKKAAKEAEKKRQKQSQIGCIVAIIVFVAVIGITAYFQNSEDKESPSQSPSPKIEDTSSSSTKSAAATTVISGGESSDSKGDDAKIKELKKAEVAKWVGSTNEQLRAVDEGWKNLWNNTLVIISEGNKDNAKAHQNIDEFNKKLEEIKANLKNQKFSKQLTNEEIDKLKSANEGYVLWIEERQELCNDLKELTESKDSSNKVKKIEEAVKKSDNQLFKTKSVVEDFQKGMGLI